MLLFALWAMAISAVNAQGPPAFAPKINQPCPTRLIRTTPAANQTPNEDEATYIRSRRALFPDAWREWIGDGSAIGYELNTLLGNGSEAMPVIAIAASGGGYRCVFFVLNWDAREDAACSPL